MKSNKSFLKRFRITRGGKLMARATGQNHFRAKKSGADRMSRRRSSTFALDAKTVGQYAN
jgi:ribosomal protein L35